ncbi:MAG: Undecaprenyl-phosphate glucose phosphotransferase [Berkelbacteria bacterium GW2011_GWB1_38_5]|uniref:Undecaprenyl-phosphate glucose phosphotransferase n=1 Tax=Berkelbacteria bacterium GW2011_GWB1_38_5 TaxID=1618336 RepID=A0A0G0NB46_9BACT|nr:MAG: Undecaprenyl-phosphate glucose phosphotransferase [Berkelbacteria bacterium GW2011_GWB1_38_5]
MKRSELFFTFLQIPVDLAMIIASFVVAYKLRTIFEFVPVVYVEPLVNYLKFVIMTLPIWFAVFVFAGLYTLQNYHGRLQEFGKILVAVSAAIAILLAWLFLSRTSFFSRLIIVYVWAIAIVLVTFGRSLIHFIQRFLFRYGLGVHRVIILGENSSSRFIITELKNNKKLGYKIVKIIDEQGIENLERIFSKNPADEIIVANPHIGQAKIAEVLEFCRAHQIGFKMTPDLFLVRSSHVDIKTIAGVPILEFNRTPLDGWGRIIKRLVDFAGSGIILIILSPIIFLVALGVKLTSKGPVIFCQDRIGFENKIFPFLKFRSMKVEYCTGQDYGGKKAEEVLEKLSKRNEVDGPVFKLKNDPRLTAFGKFIRKTSLDELPQFLNVLKGQMSLVGPRPPLPKEVEKYNKFQRRRLGVKPGITGLWQVSGRSDITFDEWVKLDAFYIEHWSLWLDFQILLKTIGVVIRGRGAY